MAGELDAACRALTDGGLVAYPTEAVYGLGCDPANPAAVARLLALKGRPEGKGLILIAERLAALEPWLAPIDELTRARIGPTWPGPVTWLLPAAEGVARAVRGDHDTLAVRVTAHPVAAALCAAWGGPLVSTSANRAGGEPARDAESVAALFGDAVDVIVGEVGGLEEADPDPLRPHR
ncbi:MAG: Sua5/YciO/YrdC/YwlC family protein [Halofilum sp. (in: g-proteobacteria)]|nr:Sua5/YciO/YrdC/YwlC family protein [Halofilum sp. (in: g-proteobacteria)]